MKKLTVRFFAGPLALLALATMFILLPGFAEENHGQKTSQATVHLWDYCDPATFNAALGSGTCNRDTTTGAITLTGFLGEVTPDKSAGAWRFSPAEIKSKDGIVALALQNVGGENRTFTRVNKFGGGFVDALSQASGNPVPAPECAQMVNGALTPQAPGPDNLFIPAGGTATASGRCYPLPMLHSSLDAVGRGGETTITVTTTRRRRQSSVLSRQQAFGSLATEDR